MHAPIEYGSSRYVLADRTMDLAFAGGSVVAVGRSPTLVPTGPLETIHLESGRSIVGPEVGAYAAGTESVVAEPTESPGRLRWYSVPTLEVVREVKIGDPVRVVTQAGSLVAAATEATVVLVEGKSIRHVPVVNPTSLAFSPDRKELAVGLESGRVEIVDVAAGTIDRTLTGGRAAAHGVVWSADGRQLAAACGKTVLLYTDVRRGTKVTLHKAKDWAQVEGFCGGRFIVHDVRKNLLAADATGKVIWKVPQYGPVAIEGERVLAASFESLRLIEAPTGKVIRTFDAPNIHLESLALLGETVVANLSTIQRLQIGDVREGTWKPEEGGHGSRITVSFEANRFATGGDDGRVCVWERGKPRATQLWWTTTPDNDSAESVEVLLLQADTVWAGAAQDVLRYRVSDGALQGICPLATTVKTLALAGGFLVATSEARRRQYGTLALLDPVTLEVRHQERLAQNFLSVEAEDARVRLKNGSRWAVYDVTKRSFVEEGPDDAWTGWRWVNRDRTLLVSADSRQKAGWLDVTDLKTGKPLVARRDVMPFSGLSGGDLDNAGQRLAASHADQKVRVWELRSGKVMAELDPGFEADGVRWFPRDETLLIWSSEGRMVEMTIS